MESIFNKPLADLNHPSFWIFRQRLHWYHSTLILTSNCKFSAFWAYVLFTCTCKYNKWINGLHSCSSALRRADTHTEIKTQRSWTSFDTRGPGGAHVWRFTVRSAASSLWTWSVLLVHTSLSHLFCLSIGSVINSDEKLIKNRNNSNWI